MPSMKPLALVVTEKLTFFDHAHVNADMGTHQGYHISTPVLCIGGLKIGNFNPKLSLLPLLIWSTEIEMSYANNLYFLVLNICSDLSLEQPHSG